MTHKVPVYRARTAVARVLLAFFVASLGGVAHAKKKPKDSSANDMTFEPEAIERKDGPKPVESTPTPAVTPSKPRLERDRPRPASSGPAMKPAAASKALERALKLYDAEDYPMSSIELNKVIEGQSSEDDANRQRAEFFMGKALFNLKFYSASLSYFDRIVQKGPTHRYYAKTLQWLASLSRFLPETAGVLERIGKYTKQDLDQPALEPVREELYYLLGRFFYSKGNSKSALELFSGVPERSEFYPKAKFFEGITYVRQGDGKQGAESFKAILRKVKAYDDPKKVPKVLREFEDLSNLSLGRVFYSTRQYDLSIKYYERLTQLSPDWPASLFEAAWAYFQRDGDSKALGNLHSITSPYFDTEFYPEAYILKAVIYFNRCNYDRSQEAINEFNNIYPNLRKEIEQILSQYPDNAQFFDFAMKVRKGEAGLSERLQHAVDGALQDRTLQKTVEYVAELERELNAIEKADPSWRSTAVANNILQDLTLQKSLAANEAGNQARMRLARLASEIQELVKQAIKIEFETLNGQKGQLTAGLSQDQVLINPNSKTYNTIQIDDEHIRWPFKGEYWKDELGYYRFKVKNQCGR